MSKAVVKAAKAVVKTTKEDGPELLDGREIHPFANLFPPMTPEELEGLTEDIRTNGLLEPVVLYEGKILDGIHRLRACLEAGIAPEYQEWDGEAGRPLQFVFSKNWSRRSLTQSQRAVIALGVEKEFAKETKPGRPKQNINGGKNATINGKSRDKAAAASGVSARYIADAKVLQKANPSLLEEVWLGAIKLPAAMAKVKKDAQESGTNPPTHKVRIVFQNQVMASDWMPEAAARQLTDALVEKDISVRLMSTGGGPKSHMYDATETWNPFKGCHFDCTYCAPSFKQQCKRQQGRCGKCYTYEPHEHREKLTKIPSTAIVFVCGNSDISFAKTAYVRDIIGAIIADNEKRLAKPEKYRGKPEKTFYLQSKKPACLAPYLDSLPNNVVLLTTLETNRDKGYDKVSNAPKPTERYKQFKALKYPRKVVTIEPVMDFDTEIFADWIEAIKPEAVWLGYNSHETSVMLPEPPHRKMMAFAQALLDRGIRVKGKELRGLEMPEGVERTQEGSAPDAPKRA